MSNLMACPTIPKVKALVDKGPSHFKKKKCSNLL